MPSEPHNATRHVYESSELGKLRSELHKIRREMEAAESEAAEGLAKVHEAYQASARNLLHYVALRHRDLRPLQIQLAEIGLSSLGRAEPHAMATLDAVLRLLYQLAGEPWESRGPSPDFGEGPELLRRHTEMLLGPRPANRAVRIMVTTPGEAATDYALVRNLVKAGMDCMRVNCAHDDEDAWERMAANLSQAKRELGRECRLLMDLGGPRLRTGPIRPGPEVIKWRPKRDAFGKVVAPARIWLAPARNEIARPPANCQAALTVPAEWYAELRPSDVIEFTDARGAERKMRLVSAHGSGVYAESSQTCYVASGTELRVSRSSGEYHHRTCRLGRLPARATEIVLNKGDILVLTSDQREGSPADLDERGNVRHPATISCCPPEVLRYVRPGEHIWFDDGKIGGIIKEVRNGEARIEITHAAPTGSRLGEAKGINLPDSSLGMPAITEKDVEDLKFVAAHADMVGMSFVRRPSDVEALQERLVELGHPGLGIVLKIETREGFENLPSILLTAMRHAPVGVMIARGDLAVECGYERLAEVQEEILWIAEAAHMPVIWATQVLESLAKKGQPSRAEITDAAMGERAECVMLNKGPYVVEAVRALDDILRRMEAHQTKKRAMLRRLRW